MDCSGSVSKNNRGLFQLFVKAAQVETDERGAEKKSYSCTQTARHSNTVAVVVPRQFGSGTVSVCWDILVHSAGH